MTEAELQALCREWQEVLRLRDWRVTLAVKRHYEMAEARCAGTCTWTQSRRMATIQIMDATDFQANWQFTDQEHTLVHELLHLHFAPFTVEENDSPADVAQEQAIDAIADALVALKRRTA